MESIFVDYQGKLGQNYTSLKEALAPYSREEGVADALAAIEEIYSKKLNNIRPQIMVYGIYNAGKSSIINELMQNDLADVADEPTTKEVSCYEWNGYRLADTPGVGGPVADEEITAEYLPQADVVLFVMSSNGSLERRQNYERMKSIIEKGKRLIIVLNDKDGILGKDDGRMTALKQQVIKNMQLEGIEVAEDKYSIVAVNARRARKGRLENKNGLLERSCMPELEKVILSELRRTSTFEVLHNGIVEVETGLQQILETLSRQDSAELDRLGKFINRLHKQRLSIDDRLADFIEKQTSRFSKEMPMLIWEKRDVEDEELQREISQALEKLCTQVQDELQKEMEEYLQEFGQDVETMKQDLLELQAELTNKAVGAGNIQISEIELDDAKNNIEVLIGKMDALGAAAITVGEALASTTGQAVLAVAAKTAIGKAVLPMLGPILPWLGPAGWIVTGISVVKSLISWTDGEADRQRAEDERQAEYSRRLAEAELQAQQELRQKFVCMSEEIADSLKQESQKTVQTIFAKLEEPINNELNNLNNLAQNRKQTFDEVSNIYDEYVWLDSKLAVQMTK
ncbi:MAG: dynamin family protein [Selenomonadaceae bacterium]|nr:dynamin family protein [Selenomonadaceae bacterium]